MDWDYQAGRINGDGTIDIIETDLPIKIESIDRRLSAPSSMRGEISQPLQRLKNQGRPVFEPWQTVILAVADDDIRGMAIYRKPTFTGEAWNLDLIGLPGYAIGQPYDGEQQFVQADPLDIYRHVWAHLQGKPRGNLGITVDPLTSNVRVGTESEDVEFATGAGEQVSFEAGPRKFSLWSTPDLGKVIDDYARSTPFDWLETFSWDGIQPHCHIRLGCPTIGGRKTAPRFVLGENLATEPSVTTEDYATEVFVLGNGEGRDAIRGYAGDNSIGIRRALLVNDNSIETVTEANVLAHDTLVSMRSQFVVEELEVHQHPNAELEAIELGDEIQLYAETTWATVDDWVRVVGRSDAPGRSDVTRLTVVRQGVL